MSVLNQTNTGRVNKIVEIIGLLQKSSTSNDATAEELWELLTPAVEAIQGMLDAEAQPEAEEAVTSTPGHQEPRWFLIHQLSREAPLDELTRAVAVFLDRIDEHLSAQKET